MKIIPPSIKLIAWLLLTMAWASCQKELSFEEGGFLPDNNATGVLNGAPGTCANFVVNGVYGQGLALDTTNNVTVEVNFATAGGFVITTDTINGIYFTGNGTVTATGIAVVKLVGVGSPLNPGPFTYKANFKGSTCTFDVTVYQTATASAGDYFPMTANSWWTYFSNDPAADLTDTAYTFSTGITGTIAVTGNTYNLFTTEVSPFKDSSFYRKNGGDYFEFGDLDVTGSTDLAVPAEWTFLKDNVAKATTWISPEVAATIASVPVKIRIRFVIKEKDVNVLLDNKVYAKTIKVESTQQVQLTPSAPFTDILTYESWFAKGIGLVNVAAPAPIYGYRVIKYTVN
jgi:hypothetical protein